MTDRPILQTHHHPVVRVDSPVNPVDLTGGYDPAFLRKIRWGIGGYGEHRTPQMYSSSLYRDGRTVHMGVDVWGPAGTSVHAFTHGVVWGVADNDGSGDYGPTVVTQHTVEGETIWALHGHLSHASLSLRPPGAPVWAGEVIGHFGDERENGGWVPHLHLQLCRKEPAQPDMPGVVHPRDVPEALRLYPDPMQIIGTVCWMDEAD